MPRKGGAFNQIKALGLVLLALLGNARVQAAAEEEVTALLLFKQGLTNADQVAELVTWSGDADSPCAWEGVTCEDSAVTSIDLHGLGLQGTIAPNSIAQLQYLKSLDLSENSLTGSIPAGWNKDGALPSLYTLNLTSNQLAQAPADWGSDGCSALCELRLGKNELNTLPEGWTFVQLQRLELAGNRISGSIPTSWNLSDAAVVELLPQAPESSTICGLVPPSPTFQYDDALHTPFNLSNSLGSCFAKPGKCANSATAVSLSGTNVFDASTDAGAAVWDTLALNSGVNPLYPSSAVVTLPCYQAGSPVWEYLGGDVAYMRPAWGSSPGGWRVTSMVPPGWPEECYTASALGAYWAVDLGYSVNVSMVILRVGPGGLNHAAITVGDKPTPSGEPCATVDSAAANTTAALRCNDSGQYLHVTASPAFTGSCVSLCSLSVYPRASSVAVNKQLTLSAVDSFGEPPDLLSFIRDVYAGPKPNEDTASPNASLWERLPGYAAQGKPSAAAALNLGYAAPVAGAHFWGDYNLFDVLVANSSLNDSGALPQGISCDRGFGVGALASPISTLPDGSTQASDGPDVVVTGPNNGTFDCRGTVGQYIIAVAAGKNMKFNGVEVFLAQQPGGAPATVESLPASPPSPSSLPPSSPGPLPSITPNSSAIENSSISESSETGGSGSNTAAIVGGVVGGVALLVAAAMFARWYMRRRFSLHGASDGTKGFGKRASETTAERDADVEDTAAGCLTDSPTDSGGELFADGSLPSRAGGARSGSSAKAIDPLLDLMSLKLNSRRMLGPFLSFSGPMPTVSEFNKNSSGVMSPKSSQCSLQPHLSGESAPWSSGGLPVLHEWLVSYEDIHMQKLIGEGSFGRVYLARWHETNVACKLLLNTGVNVDDLEAAAELAISLSNPILHNLQQEAGMMAALRHPNIVGFLGVCPSPPCVLTEYCKRGSLYDVLRAARSSPAKARLLDWPRRLNMALDAAKGLLYLHSHKPKPVVHRDLKSPNLLVDVHWRVKVSDFNLSKIMEETNAASVGIASNPRWLAPEILAGKSASFASDCWSFGVVMWELATWDCPWGTMNPWQVVSDVTDGAQLEFPAARDLPGGGFERLDAYIALARACWALDPQQRPGMAEVIADLRQILAETVSAGGAVPAAAAVPKE